MQSWHRLHGSCACRNGEAVLMIGPPGSGKSDLLLRLLSRGFDLVADDQVDVTDGVASAPTALAGLLEVRGLGIMRLPYTRQARLVMVLELGSVVERLPSTTLHPDLGLPMVRLDGHAASAADIVIMALDCAAGRIGQVSGAFVA
jgi:HPr kinase/phosphorylase